MSIEDDVRKACALLAAVAPFSYPLMVLSLIIDEKLDAPMATDGTTIIVNPKHWNTFTFKEQLFILMHEWLHVAFMHSKRIKDRNPRAYNYAADFVNNYLINATMGDHFDQPDLMLYDKCINAKTAEEVYTNLLAEVDLRKSKNHKPKCTHCNNFLTKEEVAKQTGINTCPVCHSKTNKIVPIPKSISWEDAINFLMTENFGAPWGNDILPMPSEKDDNEIIDHIIKAAARARTMSRGLLPGFFEEYVETLKRSEISWKRLLDRYMKQSLKGTKDRNPYKPDPKYLPFDIIVPTEQGGAVPKMSIIVDTSGSMQKQQLEEVLGHLEKLQSLCGSAHVISADTKVTSIVKLRNLKSILSNGGFRFKGRGGTDMTEAMSIADKMRPDLILLISDMYIGKFPPKPRSPIIFIATSNSAVKESPYGVLIKVNKGV